MQASDEDAERSRKQQGDPRQCSSDEERGPRGELPAGDGTGALDRVEPVGRGVTDVVDEVGGARRGAVGDEGGDGGDPAAGVAQLGSEDDPGEEEQVLRPLPRPQRDECGHGRRAPHRQLHDPRAHRLVHGVTLERRHPFEAAKGAAGAARCQTPLSVNPRPVPIQCRLVHRSARPHQSERARIVDDALATTIAIAYAAAPLREAVLIGCGEDAGGAA